MVDISNLFTTEILPSLQNGSNFPKDLLFSLYGDAYFSSHRIVWVRVCLIFFYALFAFIGVSTNAAVVFFLLIWHPKSLRNITNRFVLALAVSDIFMSGFNMPIQAYYEMQERAYFSSLACQLVFSTFGLPMHISCLVILVIGIDRYRIIVYPLKRRMSKHTASLTLLAIAIISVISVVPIAVFSKSSQAVTKLEDGERKPIEYYYCVEQWPSPEVRLCYTIFTFTVQFFLPLFLTATLYMRIYFRLHGRRFQKRDLERKKRTNKILIAIVICFFICWTPWNVFSIILEVYAYRTQKRNPNNDFPIFETEHGNMSETVAMKLPFFPAALTNQHLVELGHGATEESIHHSRSLEKRYNLSDIIPQSHLLFGGHAKLIDLTLKLLAMCSGCLNPCLYGCMTETMRLLRRRIVVRLQRARRHSQTQFRGTFRRFPNLFTSEKSPIKSSGPRKHCTSVYSLYCCGFQFFVQTGFHHQHGRAKNHYDRKTKSDASEPPNSSTCEQNRHIQRGSASENTSFHFSAEQKDLVTDLQPSDYQGIRSQIGIQKQDHGAQSLSPLSITFVNRGSPTLSSVECSTKRTSLLPSSSYEKTPRSSFMTDLAKQHEKGHSSIKFGQPLLCPIPLTPQVTICEAPFQGAAPVCANKETAVSSRTSSGPSFTQNYHQKFVNIEVHSPPPCYAPVVESLGHRSSFRGATKAHRTLAPLDEVSNCGTTLESPEMVECSKTQRQTKKTPVAAGVKRSISTSFENELSRALIAGNQRHALLLRRRNTYAVVERKTPTISSSTMNVDATASQSMPSDDFAYFHKVAMEEERFKVGLAPKNHKKHPLPRPHFLANHGRGASSPVD
ncbi:unnamed protein product [Mesocestoides corti]|uniref:G_PROTEIN_RECEP_F1_2 domain-containing protein n=1 Tax=Mesocestoides corti TaxID=53468 RepID=A0A0R3UFP5_MESCO|nr:unnamed protein product [Mesocestoides corti]